MEDDWVVGAARVSQRAVHALPYVEVSYDDVSDDQRRRLRAMRAKQSFAVMKVLDDGLEKYDRLRLFTIKDLDSSQLMDLKVMMLHAFQALDDQYNSRDELMKPEDSVAFTLFGEDDDGDRRRLSLTRDIEVSELRGPRAMDALDRQMVAFNVSERQTFGGLTKNFSVQILVTRADQAAGGKRKTMDDVSVVDQDAWLQKVVRSHRVDRMDADGDCLFRALLKAVRQQQEAGVTICVELAAILMKRYPILELKKVVSSILNKPVDKSEALTWLDVAVLILRWDLRVVVVGYGWTVVHQFGSLVSASPKIYLLTNRGCTHVDLIKDLDTLQLAYCFCGWHSPDLPAQQTHRRSCKVAHTKLTWSLRCRGCTLHFETHEALHEHQRTVAVCSTCCMGMYDGCLSRHRCAFKCQRCDGDHGSYVATQLRKAGETGMVEPPYDNDRYVDWEARCSKFEGPVQMCESQLMPMNDRPVNFEAWYVFDFECHVYPPEDMDSVKSLHQFWMVSVVSMATGRVQVFETSSSFFGWIKACARENAQTTLIAHNASRYDAHILLNMITDYDAESFSKTSIQFIGTDRCVKQMTLELGLCPYKNRVDCVACRVDQLPNYKEYNNGEWVVEPPVFHERCYKTVDDAVTRLNDSGEVVLNENGLPVMDYAPRQVEVVKRGGRHVVRIIDSMQVLGHRSLKDLAKIAGVTEKLDFPKCLFQSSFKNYRGRLTIEQVFGDIRGVLNDPVTPEQQLVYDRDWRDREFDANELCRTYCSGDSITLRELIIQKHNACLALNGVSVWTGFTNAMYSERLMLQAPEYTQHPLRIHRLTAYDYLQLRRGYRGGLTLVLKNHVDVTTMPRVWKEYQRQPSDTDAEYHKKHKLFTGWYPRIIPLDIASSYPAANMQPIPVGLPTKVEPLHENDVRWRTEAAEYRHYKFMWQIREAVKLMQYPREYLCGPADQPYVSMICVDVVFDPRVVQSFPCLPHDVMVDKSRKMMMTQCSRVAEWHCWDELLRAIETDGAYVVKVYRMYHWEARPVLREYVQKIMARKDALSAQMKQRGDALKAQGLDPEKDLEWISLADQRQMTKDQANSPGGKLGQNLRYPTMAVIRTQQAFNDFYRCVPVNNRHSQVYPGGVIIATKHYDDMGVDWDNLWRFRSKVKSKHAAVHVAAMMTSYARLRLNDMMRHHGDNAQYTDTDSVYAVVHDPPSDAKPWVPLGHEFMTGRCGGWEYDGGPNKDLYIERMICIGPKTTLKILTDGVTRSVELKTKGLPKSCFKDKDDDWKIGLFEELLDNIDFSTPVPLRTRLGVLGVKMLGRFGKDVAIERTFQRGFVHKRHELQIESTSRPYSARDPFPEEVVRSKAVKYYDDMGFDRVVMLRQRQAASGQLEGHDNDVEDEYVSLQYLELLATELNDEEVEQELVRGDDGQVIGRNVDTDHRQWGKRYAANYGEPDAEEEGEDVGFDV